VRHSFIHEYIHPKKRHSAPAAQSDPHWHRCLSGFRGGNLSRKHWRHATNYLKAKGTADGALVESTGQLRWVAKVHQNGLQDRSAVRAKEMQYPARPLLGLDDEDIKIVEYELLILISSGFT